jgi:hypothetical protein
MIRSRIAKAITAHIAANYEGPIQITQEDTSEALVPPCAVVRIGSSEDMGMGQMEIYDVTVLVGIFHDYQLTSADAAATGAEAICTTLDDPDTVAATLLENDLIVSSWQPTGMQTEIGENGWQHVASFHLIVSPAAES